MITIGRHMNYYANLIVSGLGYGMAQFAITYGIAQNMTISVVAGIGTMGTAMAQQIRPSRKETRQIKVKADAKIEE